METMKRFNTYTALVLAIAVGVSSCNKRSIGQVDDKYPVLFSAQNFGKADRSVTKVTDEGFEQGDVIGIYSYPSGGAMFGEGEFNRGNVPYVQMETDELLVRPGTEPLYFPTDPELALTFKAYYPYSDQMTRTGCWRSILRTKRTDKRTPYCIRLMPGMLNVRPIMFR